jgi:predicted DNA-binding protein
MDKPKQKQFNVRLPLPTKKRLEWIMDVTGMSQSKVVITAIERFAAETKMEMAFEARKKKPAERNGKT